ncbi:MAG: hypothetical protein V8R81_01345 [Clostridia bacterium]
MEEILKKMEDIASLKDRKEKIQEKQKEFENSKAEIEKMYKESNLILTASPLKDIKKQEIKDREEESKKIDAEAKEGKESLKQDILDNKKQLFELIDKEMKKYVSKEEIEKRNALYEESAKNAETRKAAYEKVAKNAEKTIEKVRKEILEGDTKNITLLKTAQEEKEANLASILKIQTEMENEKKELEELKDIADNVKEYSNLEYLKARASGISYSNIENVLEDEFYKANKKQNEADKSNEAGTEKSEKADEIEKVETQEDDRKIVIPEIKEIQDGPEEAKKAYSDKIIGETFGKIAPEYRLENKHNVEKVEETKNNVKIQSIMISEKTGEVTVIGENGEEISKNKIFKHNLKDNAEKISLYNDIKRLKLCNEIAENKKDAKKLMKKLNPSILLALQDNKEMIREYVNAVYKEEKLPFELTHDLEGMNPIKKFFKQRSKQLKAEEKCGAKILNKLFDKSKALDEGKESKEVIEPEIVEENPTEVKVDREKIEQEIVEEKQTKENTENKGKYRHATKEFQEKYKANPAKTDHEIYLDYFKQSKENTTSETEIEHDGK